MAGNRPKSDKSYVPLKYLTVFTRSSSVASYCHIAAGPTTIKDSPVLFFVSSALSLSLSLFERFRCPTFARRTKRLLLLLLLLLLFACCWSMQKRKMAGPVRTGAGQPATSSPIRAVQRGSLKWTFAPTLLRGRSPAQTSYGCFYGRILVMEAH